MPADAALAALPQGPVHFHALSLNADGTPVPVLHSDEGFEMLFGHPSPAALDAAVEATDRPFPAGLMTGIGMLVANPAYAPAPVQDLFPRTAYHGTVVWSWQQALTAAGLARQLTRTDLPATTRTKLTRMQTALWQDIEAAKGVQNSELWSWDYRDGHYVVAPYGAAGNDADESNAAQLWSTVFLAVQPPKR
ncbi:lipoprotein [Nitrospirillum viridazoti Y2]|nr:lipoprotein [Nitrospirillum amazonense Y2]